MSSREPLTITVRQRSPLIATPRIDDTLLQIPALGVILRLFADTGATSGSAPYKPSTNSPTEQHSAPETPKTPSTHQSSLLLRGSEAGQSAGGPGIGEVFSSWLGGRLRIRRRRCAFSVLDVGGFVGGGCRFLGVGGMAGVFGRWCLTL